MGKFNYLLVFYLLFPTLVRAENNIAPIPPITFSIGSLDSYPYLFSDPKGICGTSGLFIDIIIEVFNNRLNIPVDCKVLPWIRAQHSVEAGESDFMITIPTNKRLAYSVKTTPSIVDSYFQLYTYKDHPRLEAIEKINSPEDIVKLNLVAVASLGNGWYKSHIESVGVKTYHTVTDEWLPQFLAAKRADIMIDLKLSDQS